jgi:DNA helicase-2/ATP-dependent DNA helicase PcrA
LPQSKKPEVQALLEEASSRKVTLWYLIHEIVRGQKAPQTKIAKPAEQALATVIKLIENARKKMQGPTNPCLPQQLLQHIIQTLEIKRYLERTKPDDHERRWANVEELLAQASDCSEGITYTLVPTMGRVLWALESANKFVRPYVHTIPISYDS